MARGLAVNLLKINNLQFPKLFALLVDSKHTICYTKRVADNTNNMKNTNTSFATVIRTSLPAGIWDSGAETYQNKYLNPDGVSRSYTTKYLNRMSAAKIKVAKQNIQKQLKNMGLTADRFQLSVYETQVRLIVYPEKLKAADITVASIKQELDAFAANPTEEQRGKIVGMVRKLFK
jgi:hypothetical protein